MCQTGAVVNSIERRPAERRRERQRQHIVDSALTLFESHGFDDTSVDQIADASDVSPRTFFRYFPSKQDVVLDTVVDAVAKLADRLLERPDDEPIPDALCEAAAGVVADITEVERVERALAVMVTTPVLLAGFMERTSAEEILVDPIRRRWPHLGDLEASVAATMGAALLRHPLLHIGRCRDEATDPVDLLRRRFAISRRLWSDG